MDIDCCTSIKSTLVPTFGLVSTEDPEGLASVLVPLFTHSDGEIHILLTLRSRELRHHAGEVAFPGGMWEHGDDYPIGTALRESHEEIALPASEVTILGGLDAMITRREISVYPIVACIEYGLPLTPNPDEIVEIFSVPLSFFKQDQRLRTDIFKRLVSGKTVRHWVPAYEYDGYEIWGFTAAVILQLMNRCFDAGLSREHTAREKVW